MTDVPDSPVRKVRVEHVDGTVRVVEGEDAHAWAMWVASASTFASNHGGDSPDVEWEEVDDNG